MLQGVGRGHKAPVTSQRTRHEEHGCQYGQARFGHWTCQDELFEGILDTRAYSNPVYCTLSQQQSMPSLQVFTQFLNGVDRQTTYLTSRGRDSGGSVVFWG